MEKPDASSTPPSKPVLICSVGILAAFFLPWVQAMGIGGSGYTLASLGSYGNLLWIFPILAGAVILTTISGSNNRAIGAVSGSVTVLAFSTFLIGLSMQDSQNARLVLGTLSVGVYLNVIFGATILIAAAKPATPKNVWTVVIIMFIAMGGVVATAAFYGNTLLMGERYKVSEKESVNYSANATKADAKKLGDILKTDGYFDGSKSVDVLLKKDDKEGMVISFVISGVGKDETIATAFKQIGEGIAKDGFGKPLTIRLIDTHLNTLKDIKVE